MNIETETPEVDNSPESFATAPNPGEEVVEQQATEQQEEQPGDEQTEQPDPYAEAPEFWSAERKALWERVQDPEIRQALHEQEKERVASVNKKIEEAALGKKDVEAKVTQYERERDELVNWWKQTAPQIAQSFQSKWAGVDWNKLAEDNPAEYVRLKAAADHDFGLIQQAAQRHQGEIQKANQRAEAALNTSKREAHATLEKTLPEYFAPDKAQKTYDDIRDYLLAQGTPAERIPHIYEPFVVSTALKAMLYDKAKAAAKVNPTGAAPATAVRTPTRLAPGPATKAGNRSGEAERQAMQRLRTGERLSDSDVAKLFA